MNYLLISLLVLIFVTSANARKVEFFAKYGFWPNKKKLLLPFRKKDGRLCLANAKLSGFFVNYAYLDLQISSDFGGVIIYLPVVVSSKLFSNNRMSFLPEVPCRAFSLWDGRIFYEYKNYLGKKRKYCPEMMFDLESGSFSHYEEGDCICILRESEATKDIKEKEIFYLGVKEGVIYPYKK